MFTMNPLNLPDATLQHWIMLFVAGMLGFIIGYISRKGMIAQLEGDLASTTRELTDCQRVVAAPLDQETLILNRVRARAGELDITRIGLATPADADDLKAIIGVGPFLEKKLHAVGIYTFRQVASFTKEDVAKVNDIIEFFPGRIERDDWVGQSADFERRKRSNA
jgi:predicted flap endonuclease-1-like 5' DNA nuclease